MLKTSQAAQLQRWGLVLLCAALILSGGIRSALGHEEANAPLTGAETSPREIPDFQDAFALVIERIKPTVVNISRMIEEESPQGDSNVDKLNEPHPPVPTEKASGLASGFIISEDGYILTNNHVVRGATSLWIILSDERKFRGKLVGRDARSDIAVIKIDTDTPLPFAKLGDSDNVRVGDWVLAFGSPFGFDQTVTHGIVSAKRQMQILARGNINHFIQIDASINRGSSGGPLCNVRSEVVGINKAIYSPKGQSTFSGIGLAISINSVKEVVTSLIREGKFTRGWLGIKVKTNDEPSERWFRLPDQYGVTIDRVVNGSPAAEARLKRGDIILAADGEKVNALADLMSVVNHIKPKEKVNLRIMRAQNKMDIPVTAMELPADEPTL